MNTTSNTSAIEILYTEMQKAVQTAEMEGVSLTEFIPGGMRVYTRLAHNPDLNRNGGDYDYWTDFFVRDGKFTVKDGWSCELDGDFLLEPIVTSADDFAANWITDTYQQFSAVK